MLYIPRGCAHGFQTLADDSEIVYFTSAAYAPDADTGARHGHMAPEPPPRIQLGNLRITRSSSGALSGVKFSWKCVLARHCTLGHR